MSSEQETTHAKEDQKPDHSKANKNQARDFVCKCGKTYLSYPALYTHIKNKHGSHEISSMIRKSKDNNKTTLQEFKVDPTNAPLKDIVDFVKLSAEFGELYEPKDITGAFDQSNEIVRAFVRWQNKSINQQQRVNAENGLVTVLSIDQVFGKLVYKLFIKVEKQILIEVITILTLWRKHLNSNYTKYDPKNSYADYCREAPPTNILESVNDFLYDEIVRMKADSGQAVKLLANRRREYYVVRFLFLLSKWLYADRFTNLMIKFNLD